jgi:hypothetical protein
MRSDAVTERAGAAGLLLAVAVLSCSPESLGVHDASPNSTMASERPIATSSPAWPAVITPAALGAPECRPPSQLVAISSGGLRPLLGTPARGTATRAVLALFLAPIAGVEQKMVVRMSGTGPVTMNAYDQAGLRLEITRIDAGHGSSSYDPIFPGTSEWGVLFTFPTQGCWRIEVLRVDAAADFYIEVATN